MGTMSEYTAGINRLGKDVLNQICKKRGGDFPTTVSTAEIKGALSDMNRDTSDSFVRVVAKALEREGVRTPIPAGTMESDNSRKADLLISGAIKGVPVTESLTLAQRSLPEDVADDDDYYEAAKSNARQTAEKMARKAGKSEQDDDWEKTVSKFEKQQESLDEGGYPLGYEYTGVVRTESRHKPWVFYINGVVSSKGYTSRTGAADAMMSAMDQFMRWASSEVEAARRNPYPDMFNSTQYGSEPID